MNFKNDLFSNTLYSILISIVIISSTEYVPTIGIESIPILKNFIISTLLVLLLKVLTRENKELFIFFETNLGNKSTINLGLTVIKDFIEFKLAALVLIFSLSYFILNDVIISQLAKYSIQLFTVCIYVLSTALISTSYLKISIDSIKFILLLFTPYFLGFLLFEFFELNILFFALIPANFNLIFNFKTDFLYENIVLVCISTLLFIGMFVSIFLSVRNLKNISN